MRGGGSEFWTQIGLPYGLEDTIGTSITLSWTHGAVIAIPIRPSWTYGGVIATPIRLSWTHGGVIAMSIGRSRDVCEYQTL